MRPNPRPPIHARQPRIDANAPPEAALKQILCACLEQVQGNAAAIATGRAEPEHLHQLRIGLRRLRSALRLFGAWAGRPFEPCDPALRPLLRALGTRRDHDVLCADILPQLSTLGAPPLPLPRPPPIARIRRMLDAAAFRDWLLSLQTYVDTPADPQAASAQQATAQLAKRRLAKLEKRLRKECRVYAAADEAHRHRLRKRLKRLRYGIELASDLLPSSKRERALMRLKPLQETMGRYNDICNARALLEGMSPCAGLWFALGWAEARRSELLREAERSVLLWSDRQQK
ncbi:CHAD domain-containing protein [Roseateles sp. DAIF2]|uniref:CHAD domain-containing protein n=1 Tax=Roseateles sp. DAIF2 TaxID=2714952 RepID=UPI0018A32818|nr:CHAD domain-containing protein [Roseateles sp. DAIF2]QPF74638.1 CHAD domain-containing protein [Roseateles sp. DAIF2]